MTWQFISFFSLTILKCIYTSTSKSAGAAADIAESSKLAKYAELVQTHHFATVAIETLGAYGRNSWNFIRELGSRLSELRNPTALLRQRLSVAVQRGNVLSINGTHRDDNIS